MDSNAGAGDYRVEWKQNTKNKTYLMNGTIMWLSIDAQGGGR